MHHYKQFCECYSTHTNVKNEMKICLCKYDYFVNFSWKGPKCSFRAVKRLWLKSVPMLMVWDWSEEVEDTECSNPDMVSMLFELP